MSGGSEPVPTEGQQLPRKGQRKNEAAGRGLRPDPRWPSVQVQP